MFVLPAPFSAPGDKATCEEGVENGIYLDGEALVFLHDKVTQVLFNFVLKNEGR